MDILFLISLILFAAGGIFSMQRQMQMFQQNSYFPSRYFKWLKTSFSFYTVYSAMFCIITVTLAIVDAVHFMPFIAAFELIVRAVRHFTLHKKCIKKLVYTARVKRLIITACVVSALCVLLWLFVPVIGKIFAVLLILDAHFPQWLMLLSDLINKPIERSISNHYIKDAKNILARHRDLLTVGVTGSYGKTSVKFILNRILSEKYNVTATPESFNTPMGIVRTVREHMKPQTEVFIAEMGAKNIGDIKELCELCHPTLGVITAVGPQHLETFGSVENVANTKFELADACLKAENGRIYVNSDSTPARDKAMEFNADDMIVTFGTDSNADCKAENIAYSPDGTTFTAVYKEHRLPLSCKLLGKHSVTNILGAVAVALDLGISERQIRFAVSSLKTAPHRLELKPFLNGSVLIDDAYNSNPEGCLEAVRVLGSFEGMRKIVVTPGLVELGEKEYECNFALGSEAAKQCDDIILVGAKRAVPMKDAIDKTNFDASRVIIAENFKAAMEHLKNMTDRNTVVLFENDLPDNYAG